MKNAVLLQRSCTVDFNFDYLAKGVFWCQNGAK